MPRNNQSFNRRERERAKKQKANDKRQRRLTKADGDETTELDEENPAGAAPDQGEVLRQLAELNERFDAGDITFDDFDEQRAALIALIEVD